MAYPPLTVLTGDAQAHMTGQELLDQIAPFILEHLHSVPQDDPHYRLLDGLARDSRHRSTTPWMPKGAA